MVLRLRHRNESRRCLHQPLAAKTGAWPAGEADPYRPGCGLSIETGGMMQSRSLRVRMMFLFCLVVAVLLSGMSLVIYSVFAREVRAQLDRRLLEVANPMVAEMIDNPREQQDISRVDIPKDFVELLDQSSRVLVQSKSLQGRPLDLGSLPLPNSEAVYRTLNDGARGRLRAAIVSFRIADKSVALVIAESTADTEFVLGNFRRILIVLLA